MKTNEDNSAENKQGLFIQSLLEQESHPPWLVFGRDSEPGKGNGKAVWGVKEKASGVLSSEMVDMGKLERAN